MSAKQPVIGALVREKRKQWRMSLQQLADAAGLSKSHIWEIEQGRTDPSFSVVVRVARALDTPIILFAHCVKDSPR